MRAVVPPSSCTGCRTFPRNGWSSPCLPSRSDRLAGRGGHEPDGACRHGQREPLRGHQGGAGRTNHPARRFGPHLGHGEHGRDPDDPPRRWGSDAKHRANRRTEHDFSGCERSNDGHEFNHWREANGRREEPRTLSWLGRGSGTSLRLPFRRLHLRRGCSARRGRCCSPVLLGRLLHGLQPLVAEETDLVKLARPVHLRSINALAR